MQGTKSLKDLAYNVLNRSKSNAKPQRRITLTLQHQNENVENKPGARTDKTDRSNSIANVSVLSVPPQRIFNKKLGNMSAVRPDKPDRLGTETNMSGPSQGDLDKSALLDDYGERLAIAEHDGCQNEIQAQRIAYQDAFIAVLNTLPHEEEQGYYDEDWLTRRIKAAQSWLVAQGLHQPK